MPTRRARHTITETPPVEQALRRLRAIAPEVRIDLKELVMIGAHAKADELERNCDDSDQRRERELDDFIALRADGPADAQCGLALHESGWVHRI